MVGNIQPNIVVCPHCNESFEHNKVNGVALIQLISDIDARKRMYLKLTLDSFERLIKENNFTLATTRKTLFDNVNDLIRDIHSHLGYGNEAE